MKLQFRKGQDIVFLDKPAGIATHAVEKDQLGFVEFCEKRLGQKLWVVHRLDKGTTGALAFATSPERAEVLRQQFQAHQVRKVYWFLTDRVSEKNELECESFIEKRGSQFISDPQVTPNAKTKFKRIKRSPFFELWEAQPLSGKPHQIRLHAADLGLPLLGDEKYGGTPFPHLCLHALGLEIPGEAAWLCPAPRFFERLGVLKDPELVQILASLDRRQRLFGFLQNRDQSLRLLHKEGLADRMDRFGEVLWLNWYRDSEPSERDLERWNFVRSIQSTPLVIQKREDRGQNPQPGRLWELGEVPESWVALEGDLKFQFRKQQGLSAGLFLDQRLNREKIRALSSGKSVLNLFAYTCGFSLAAARGGATQVTTVDLSANFLNWGKENFQLNGLNPENFEWSAADSFLYLQGAAKRSRQWDFVLCDPPSFSRSGKKVFRLKDDLEGLLEMCAGVLAPKGTLFFSCNLESASSAVIEKRIRRLFPKAKIEEGEQDLDYELPREEKSLKSFWISGLK